MEANPESLKTEKQLALEQSERDLSLRMEKIMGKINGHEILRSSFVSIGEGEKEALVSTKTVEGVQKGLTRFLVVTRRGFRSIDIDESIPAGSLIPTDVLFGGIASEQKDYKGDDKGLVGSIIERAGHIHPPLKETMHKDNGFDKNSETLKVGNFRFGSDGTTNSGGIITWQSDKDDPSTAITHEIKGQSHRIKLTDEINQHPEDIAQALIPQQLVF